MSNQSILLLVGTNIERKLVSCILEAADLPMDRIKIHLLPKKQTESFLSNIPDALRDRCAVLIDMDAPSIPEALEAARKRLKDPPVEVFCAVPEIEAWLFADDNLARENASSELGRELVSTLPMPEEIKTPKTMATLVFESKNADWKFVKRINITRASARSPSLRHFLNGISRLLDIPHPTSVEIISRSISRDVFAGLIGEVVPAETIIWRTANGEAFTAAELRKQIEEGTEIGRQYSSDVLRVARDFLKSMANRG